MRNFNFVDNIVKDVLSNKSNISRNITMGGTFIARTSGIVSGVEMFIQVLEKMNRLNKVYHIKSSQDLVNRGDSLVSIRGNASDVLAIRELGENLLSSICSVSTTVSKYLQEIKDLDVNVLVCENGISGIGEYYDKAVIDGGGNILYKDTMYLSYLVWMNLTCLEME